MLKESRFPRGVTTGRLVARSEDGARQQPRIHESGHRPIPRGSTDTSMELAALGHRHDSLGGHIAVSLEEVPGLPISGPGLQIEAGKHTMPKSGGNKDTEAGAGGQRKRRAGEDTGASGSWAVKTEPVGQGQRKRRAKEGGGQELPGG
jgi:hypothetical protein